jgi:hypothetical protein
MWLAAAAPGRAPPGWPCPLTQASGLAPARAPPRRRQPHRERHQPSPHGSTAPRPAHHLTAARPGAWPTGATGAERGGGGGRPGQEPGKTTSVFHRRHPSRSVTDHSSSRASARSPTRRSGRLQDGFPRRRWPSISGWSAWRRACGRRGSSTHVCRFGRIFAACSASSGAAILRLLGRGKTGKAAVEGAEFFVDAHQPPLGGSGDGRIPGSVIWSQRLHHGDVVLLVCALLLMAAGRPSQLSSGCACQKACPEVFLCGQSRVRVFA